MGRGAGYYLRRIVRSLLIFYCLWPFILTLRPGLIMSKTSDDLLLALRAKFVAVSIAGRKNRIVTAFRHFSQILSIVEVKLIRSRPVVSESGDNFIFAWGRQSTGLLIFVTLLTYWLLISGKDRLPKHVYWLVIVSCTGARFTKKTYNNFYPKFLVK